MSWYRTYRPRQIADLHLAKVRNTFQQFLKQGKLSQVMLFAGPKGTGKTTTARIVAALINDPPNYAVIEHLFFGKPSATVTSLQEPDPINSDLEKIYDGRSFLVQELDAASNRGIDDIRVIKERINLPPQQGLMTVYILDEVHMLTTEAFNALLKLLEEPPAHVLFILATTELHKVPETIKSRATLIEFTRATTDELADAITRVLNAEKKKFEPAAVQLLAQAADGSFRDAIKLTETVAATAAEVSVTAVEQLVTQNVSTTIDALISAVLEKQPDEVARLLGELRSKNLEEQYFLKQLLTRLHTNLHQHLGLQPGTPVAPQAAILFLLQEIGSLPNGQHSSIPFLSLELKLLDLIFRSKDKKKATTPPAATPPRTEHSSPMPVSTQPAETVVSAQPSHVTSTLEVSPLLVTGVGIVPRVEIPTLSAPVLSDNLASVAPGDSSILLSQWQGFVELVHQKNSSLGALLRSAKPLTVANGSAKIAVYYKFHQEQLQQPKFMKMIAECLEPLTGGHIALEFIVQEPPAKTADSVASDSNATTLVKLAEELLV